MIPSIIRPCWREARVLAQRRTFRDLVLPTALERVRRRLSGAGHGGRQMVKVRAAVVTDGLIAVEAACAQTVVAELVRPVIRNILAHPDQTPASALIAAPASLSAALCVNSTQ